jgi:hypothetical protein
MADINLERKKSSLGWLWILLALLLVGLLLWWFLGANDDEVGDEVYDDEAAIEETVEPVPPATDAEPLETTVAAGVPVAAIVASPQEWIGRTVEGEVEVGEVPTDRGFWIEGGGERLFALILDEPAEEPVDINEGQTLDISRATVRDIGDLDELAGDTLDDDTRAILEDQEVFLMVPESSLARYPGDGAS